ncbi:hypothetical protein [Spirosoma radiotolerans]|uniref:Lipocalin-like domain-containing protein n=1 Tax=Spirosoma radiotolerans TaxID=1379870 RepID=A0A0E3VA90_9BACT|nr:hypothetical protein [Spirosoma radiotolerans]AKD57866.1 hypothetical protein SD10_26150 [Spirosoma radiotolerans]
MKKTLYLSLALLLASLLIDCKDTATSFSPGPGDSRITGTWRLVERYFSKDSVKSVLTEVLVTQHDTVSVTVGGQVIKKDSLITEKDTVFVKRDTSFYTTKYYTPTPAQTLTFGADGQLTHSGSEMTYYAPIKYYRVDATYPDSLFINFFINTNRATIPFQQRMVVQQDMLMLLTNCNQAQPCYSKFVRVK